MTKLDGLITVTGNLPLDDLTDDRLIEFQFICDGVDWGGWAVLYVPTSHG